MASNLVCNEGKRVSPNSPCQSQTPFIGNSLMSNSIIGVKSNITTAAGKTCIGPINLLYIITSNARVETRGPKNRKESEQKIEPRSDQFLVLTLCRYSVSYSTAICKLVDIILALHESDWQIPNKFSAKTANSSYAVPSQQYDQRLYSCCARCPSPLNYDVTCQTI